jgi:putative hydrolase of the HAD superfamily
VEKLGILFFDIDDTLFSTSGFARRARRNAVRAMVKAGLQVPLDVCLRELEEVVGEFSSNYEHHFDRLLQRLPPESLGGRNPALLVAAAVIAYHGAKLRQLVPFPEVPTVLARLAKAGLRLGVITEGPAVKQAEKLLRLKLAEYFDPSAIFISDQLGISKPNPKLYRRACLLAEVQPARAMYVGDNAPNDVDPANAVGMKTVLCRRGGRHEAKPSRTPPTHTISNLAELEALLRKGYGVPVKAAARARQS